jgi:arylsulfatase A-like enzyme
LDYQHRHEDAALLGVDDSVHAIMNALQARGALDNTVIVYLTDNGYSFGEHRWIGKRCAYDECTRTPFYVRYPDATMHTDNTVISNADIAPTLAELAGASPQLPEDGRSLVPLIQGGANEREFRRLGVVLEWAGDLDIPQYWALRTKRWLYVEYPTTGETELYDMEGSVGPADTYQLHNLSGDPSVVAPEALLSAELHRLIGQQALQSPVAAGNE